MSILVLGKNGQVGQAVTNALQGENAIFWTRGDMDSVSYTHLTLPTICSV